MDIADFRTRIDEIDAKIVELFSERMDAVAEIAAYKKARGLPVRDAEREREKLASVASRSPDAIREYTDELYSVIMKLSRSYQEKLTGGAGLKCGLLGKTLGHSYSPAIHKMLGGYEYALYEKDEPEIEEFLKSGEWDGLNVTIPYKKTVLPFLDALGADAAKTGSVNTIIRKPDVALYGDNTDVYGFNALIGHSGIRAEGKKALVLGSGGASAAAVSALEALGAEAVVISRTGDNNYGNLEKHRDAELIINATPVGMYPENGVSPIDLRLFPECRGVLDAVYNPRKTALLLQAEKLGIPCEGGLYMLVAQAKRASALFTGISIPDSETERIFREIAFSTQNIVLIGMPGVGKSTVAAALGAITGRAVFDSDIEITRRTGFSPEEIIARDGETAFRDAEERIISELGKMSGAVIATGGGAVTREKNYASLRQNGIIVRLCRDISSLPDGGRPLSRKYGVSELYAEREALYRRFADIAVEIGPDAEGSARKVLSAVSEKVRGGA